MKRPGLRSILCILVLFASSGRLVNAQVLYGSLTGNVNDPTGAPVPGAHVEAVNEGTNAKSAIDTDVHGVYHFTELQGGFYKLTVTAKSFATFTETGIEVQVSAVRRVDVQLSISTVAQSVVVSADSVVLQTDKADIHTEITRTEVESLPYNGSEGKNFQALLLLQPGANTTAGTGEANSAAGNPQRAITVSQNGISSQANNTRLDGAIDAYPWLPVNIAYVPSPEAIDTVSVSTNAFDAEQGSAGGAAINVSIKSGTNNLHGVAFERNTNNDITAINNYFSHPGRLGKNILNQFGFAIGGPVWIPKIVHGRNKLFWFMDYESTRQSPIRQRCEPDAAYGSHAHRRLQRHRHHHLRSADWQPSNGTGRTPFPGNMIPSNRIAAASATLAGQLPALTRNQFLTNYDAYGDTHYIVDRWDWKVNYNPNSRP
jgi:hypothetical protein